MGASKQPHVTPGQQFSAALPATFACRDSEGRCPNSRPCWPHSKRTLPDCAADHYQHWAATHQRPGINYINPESYDAPALRQQLAAAREEAASDLLVVCVHW